MKLFDHTLDNLSSALDARLRKQNVLNSNLANVDTPGYRAQDLDFQQALHSAQAETAAKQAQADGVAPMIGANVEGEIPVNQPAPTAAGLAIPKPVDSEPGLDGNSVDVDRTMVELAQNGLLYGAAAKTAQHKLSILKFVASDGAA